VWASCHPLAESRWAATHIQSITYFCMSDSPSQYTARNQVSLGPAMGLLAQGAVFWKPDYLRPSPWLEHVPMLFWLAEAVQPRLAVSVGEGGDVSHFALCQATDRLRLDAACYLVAE